MEMHTHLPLCDGYTLVTTAICIIVCVFGAMSPSRLRLSKRPSTGLALESMLCSHPYENGPLEKETT